MKKLVAIAIAAFGFAASASWTTTVYTTTVDSQADAMAVISAINSGRISVHGCNGTQEVYAYNLGSGNGSFVRSADGTFREVGPRATFKVRCQE